MATEAQLLRVTQQWRARLAKALLAVVNSQRATRKRKPLPPNTLVYFPRGQDADLYLFNLKVWSLRYCITPEFLVEALLERYGHKLRVQDGTLAWLVLASHLGGK